MYAETHITEPDDLVDLDTLIAHHAAPQCRADRDDTEWRDLFALVEFDTINFDEA